MKKLILLAFVAISFVSLSQDNWCGFDQKLQKDFDANPLLENQMYDRFDRINSGQIVAQDRTDPIIIPVVVHVLHDGDEGNISYAQIEDGIRVLNEDYNRLNADASNTRNTAQAPFLPVAATIGIQFVLAKIDPDGNCTNGVERRDSPLAANVGNDDNTKFYANGGLDAWDRNRYFNVWTVNDIENDGGGGTILGYAQFPSWGSASTYGLIMRHDRMGEIGTSFGGRTLSHEVGHCLGLLHPFQSGCGSSGSSCSNQGDGICDTPPVNEPHWSCASSQNYCPQVPIGDAYGFDADDQFENFMSYSPCQNMFSEGQKSVILANFSSINHMVNLASHATQIATGVNLPAALCQAEFSSSSTIICAGSTVDFADESFFGVTGRTWTFDGGMPLTSPDSATTVTYNTPGVYAVTLEVTNGTNSQTEIKTNYISVLPNPGTTLPYHEGFENLTTFPDNYNYFIENDDNGNTWEITNDVASTGGVKSLKLTNYNVAGGTEDRFVTGPIDLSVLDASENFLITFDYAYNKRTSGDLEKLRVYVSKDCGVTWSLRKNIQGDNLSSVVNSSEYTPADKSEWTTITIDNVTSSYYVSNFRVMFQFLGDNGNNIYLDNINLYPQSWLSTTESKIENSISVYPNPATNLLNITFLSTSNQNVTIDIYNAVGQKVNQVYAGNVSIGENNFNTSITSLANGIYYVKIKGDSISKTVKIIKN